MNTKKLLTLAILIATILTACGSSATPDRLATAAVETVNAEIVVGAPTEDVEATVEARLTEIARTEQQEALTEESIEALPTLEPTEPQPTPNPTPTEISRTRVVAKDNYEAGLTKLESIAFERGIRFIRFGSFEIDEFFDELRLPDVKLAIYHPSGRGGKYIEGDLLKLSEFIDRGGRVVFFYDENWAETNEVLKRLFSISVANEDIVNKKGLFFFNESLLPSYMSGMSVVMEGPKYVQVRAYLTTTIEGGERNYIESQSTKENRLLFFTSPDKSITFLVVMWTNEGMSFLDDSSIHKQDNGEAALALLNYLLED